MTESSKTPLLMRVRIESVVRDGRKAEGRLVDLETGRSIYCKKIELTHEANKNPVLVIHVLPIETEYLIDGVEAELSEGDNA